MLDRLLYSCCVGIIFFFCVLPVGNGWTGENKKEDTDRELTRGKHELEGLKKQIQQEKTRLQQAREKEKKVISELDRIEKELLREQENLRNYEEQIRKKNKEIEQVTLKTEELSQALDKETATLARNAQVLYQLSRTNMADAFFIAQTSPDLVRRYEYLTRIVASNIADVEQFSRTLAEVDRHRQLLREHQSHVEALAGKSRSTHRNVIQHKTEKTTLLATVESEKEAHVNALKELEEASRRLQTLIEQLGKKRASASSFAGANRFSAEKRKFNFPADGAIITHFGKQEDREFSTIAFNSGIEIGAASGSPIKAISDGAVIYADWFKGYGNLIIIDHGDGYYTLSGHACELIKHVGEQVKAGETIGYVGDTGSLKGANLYFEIRHHGKPLNPLDWFKQLH